MQEETLGEIEHENPPAAWRSLRLRHVGMGFFWACSMLTFRSSILLSGNADSPSLATLVTVLSFVANMTALFLFAARAERSPHFYQRIPNTAVGAVIMVGLVLLFVAGGASGPGLYLLLGLGSALTGTGYGFLWGSWAECFGRMHPSRTALYVPLSFLVTAALFLGISLVANGGLVPSLLLMLPLPAISLWCLEGCRKEFPAASVPRRRNGTRNLEALESLISLLVASIILSCLFGFVWEMAVMAVNSVDDAHQLPLFGNLIAALGMVAFVLVARKRLDIAVAFRVLVPLIVVLFAVLPFFWQERPVLLNAVMSTCYGIFDVIIWYSVASAAYDFAVSGYVVGGIVRAVSILSRLLGIGIGYLVMLVPDDASSSLVAISVAALYALFMLLIYHFSRERHRTNAPEEAVNSQPPHPAPAETLDHKNADDDTGGTSAGENTSENANEGTGESAIDADDESDVLEAIVEDYGLTRREAEVLPFLARGRSARIIAEALFVSESTIRTHTRRILEKTDLHSKQELIDLIDSYQAN